MGVGKPTNHVLVLPLMIEFLNFAPAMMIVWIMDIFFTEGKIEVERGEGKGEREGEGGESGEKGGVQVALKP